MRLSLTNVRRPTSVGRRLREDLCFKDENDLGVGGFYVAGLWTNLQIEIPPNGEAEQGHRFDISAGNLQEVLQAASMQIDGVRMQ